MRKDQLIRENLYKKKLINFVPILIYRARKEHELDGEGKGTVHEVTPNVNNYSKED